MRRSGAAGRANRGFTLIEAMMAVALMVAILGALAAVAAQWLPNWNRGFARVQRAEALALGLDRLIADLRSVEMIPLGAEGSEMAFEGTELSLVFVRTAVGPNSVGLEFVRIAEAGDDRGLTLVRSTTPFAPTGAGDLAGSRLEFGNPVVLVRAPYRVSFAYAGPDRVWRRTWRNAATMPRAVRLTVRAAGTERLLAVSTVVSLQSTLPVACIHNAHSASCLDGSMANSRGGGADNAAEEQAR